MSPHVRPPSPLPPDGLIAQSPEVPDRAPFLWGGSPSCYCPRAGWSISEIFGAHQLNIELGQSHWNQNGMTSRAFWQLLIHLYQSSKARTQGLTFPSSCDLIKNLPARLYSFRSKERLSKWPLVRALVRSSHRVKRESSSFN